jgi:hypothetical protein
MIALIIYLVGVLVSLALVCWLSFTESGDDLWKEERSFYMWMCLFMIVISWIGVVAIIGGFLVDRGMLDVNSEYDDYKDYDED